MIWFVLLAGVVLSWVPFSILVAQQWKADNYPSGKDLDSFEYGLAVVVGGCGAMMWPLVLAGLFVVPVVKRAMEGVPDEHL